MIPINIMVDIMVDIMVYIMVYITNNYSTLPSKLQEHQDACYSYVYIKY